MASSTPFGAIPQSEGIAGGMERAIHGEEKRSDQADKPTADSSSTDASLTEKKDMDGTFDTNDGRERVEELARTFSVKSEAGTYINPFSDSKSDPSLDPQSPKFNAAAWVKQCIGISSRDPEQYPKRVAGISYRNLNVHGFGNPTDYQKTVRHSSMQRELGIVYILLSTARFCYSYLLECSI